MQSSQQSVQQVQILPYMPATMTADSMLLVKLPNAPWLLVEPGITTPIQQAEGDSPRAILLNSLSSILSNKSLEQVQSSTDIMLAMYQAISAYKSSLAAPAPAVSQPPASNYYVGNSYMGDGVHRHAEGMEGQPHHHHLPGAPRDVHMDAKPLPGSQVAAAVAHEASALVHQAATAVNRVATETKSCLDIMQKSCCECGCGGFDAYCSCNEQANCDSLKCPCDCSFNCCENVKCNDKCAETVCKVACFPLYLLGACLRGK